MTSLWNPTGCSDLVKSLQCFPSDWYSVGIAFPFTAQHQCGSRPWKETIRTEPRLHLCGRAAETVRPPQVPDHDWGEIVWSVYRLYNLWISPKTLFCPFLSSTHSPSLPAASAQQATAPPPPHPPKYQTLPSPQPPRQPPAPPWAASCRRRAGEGC